jgi:hypothetical protein
VVFVVPPLNFVPEATLGTGDGNVSRLYYAHFKNGSWGIREIGTNTFAELPSVKITADNHAVVVYRQFAAKLNTHMSGHLAIAVSDLNTNAPRWTTGYLDNGIEANTQIAFDVDTGSSSAFFIHLKTNPPIEAAQRLSELPRGEIAGGKIDLHNFTEGDLGVGGGIVSYLADLTIDHLVVSNPHPLRNETVLLTAFIRNSGLKSVLRDSEMKVKFYEQMERGKRKLIGTQQVDELAFNDAASVTVPLKVKNTGIAHAITAEITLKDRI